MCSRSFCGTLEAAKAVKKWRAGAENKVDSCSSHGEEKPLKRKVREVFFEEMTVIPVRV
jgi:hypothetical protein